jgi:probable O-glycosylation ligase (exosortase A-associated)
MTAAGRTASSSGVVQALSAVAAGVFCSAIVVFPRELLPLLLVVSGIAAFGFVILRPDIGLYLLAFISYLNLSDIVIRNANAPSIAKFTVAALLAAVILRRILFGVRLGGAPSSYAVLALLWLLAVSSVLYADYPDESLAAAERLTKDILFAVLIVMIVVDVTSLRRLVWSLILAGIVMAGITVYQALTGSFDNDLFGLGQAELHQIVGDVADYRPGGPLGEPNMYAQVLLLLVPLAAERMANERSWFLKAVAGAGFAVCILAIIFTYSRGALLALVVVCLAMAVPLFRRRRIALTALPMIGLVLFLTPSAYIDRLQKVKLPSVAGSDADESLEGRSTEMVVAWRMFVDHPMLGVGLENYPLHFQKYVQKLHLPARHENRKSHSLYLQIAAERGAVGLASFAIVMGVALRSVFRGRRELRGAGHSPEAGIAGAIALSLLGYGVAAIFLHGDYGRYLWIMVGLAMCVAEVARTAKAPTLLRTGRKPNARTAATTAAN